MIPDLLRARRSVRRFTPETPARELLEELVRAATLAPSASNAQPWRFVVVTSRETIAALAAAVRDAVTRLATAAEEGLAPSFVTYAEHFLAFASAPAVIVPLYRSVAPLAAMLGDTVAEPDRRAAERVEATSGLISTALALENLLLAAPALGLGATVMTGPLLAETAIRELLAVRPGWELLAVVPVGFPAEAPEPTPRKELSQVVRFVE